MLFCFIIIKHLYDIFAKISTYVQVSVSSAIGRRIPQIAFLDPNRACPEGVYRIELSSTKMSHYCPTIV